MATHTAAIAITKARAERQRVRAQAVLRNRELMFRLVFENAAIGMALANTDQKLMRSNRASAAMLGYTDAELRGLKVADVVHPGDRAERLRLYQSLTAKEIDRFQTDVRYVRKDGTLMWGRLTASRVPQEGKAWLDAGLPPIVVSVNISARQFQQQDVAAWVLGALREMGLAPASLELELTESLIALNVEQVINAINQLRFAGVKLSIDDFGTGYSNLGNLKRFRVDTLKIDQSFVRNVLTDADDASIALAIISLAHSLRMRVLAEGVETAEQYEFLRLNGCDEIQGYYFSKPVPAGELAALLHGGKGLVGERRNFIGHRPTS